MRYDRADRLVFSQDGNRRAKGEWSFFFYDVFGRQTVSGTWKSTTLPPLTNLAVKTEYSGSGILGGHNVNLTLPSIELMTVNYYDDYAFTSGISQLNYGTPPSGYGTQFTSAKGLMTGIRTYRLDDPLKYTVSALYYDHRGRVVQSHASNHMGGFDDEYFAYTFTGKVNQHQQVHSAPGKTTQTEVHTYSYDHAERLLSVTHKLNSAAAVTLAHYTYDEIGRVKTKKLAIETSTYSYNVRSWLTGIAGTRFNQTLAYNSAVNGITPTKKLYNGNIGAMKWKAGDESTERGYKFSYDGLNRLTAAAYGEGASITSNPDRFNKTVAYNDKMGNIKTLQRQGKLDSGYGMMDNLTYTYTGNKLNKVTDAVTAPITYPGTFHFVDRANVANEYTYDVNGNLTKDLNKNITSITYNALNLPSVITFTDGNTITYGYDATGSKLSVAYTAGGTTTKTEYAGNKVYKNGTLSMILTEEGYITLSGSTSTYHYYLRDHQGNNRVVLNQSGTVEQVNHYYPFGELFGEGIQTVNQPYRYNGKELDRFQNLDVYDYGARHYDAAIGRWLTVDPAAELMYNWSPYNYTLNNPLRFTDPTGMVPEEEDPEKKKKLSIFEQMYQAFNSVVGRLTYDMGLHPHQIQSENPAEIENASHRRAITSETVQIVNETLVSLVPGGEIAYKLGMDREITGEDIAWEAAGILLGVKVGANAAKTSTTVLGHFPEYLKLAESIGARSFQIPTGVWNKMSAAEQWTANSKFLDRMILRGDNIRLATPLNQVKPGSFFQKELNYLFDKGYKVSSDGLWLVK
ncbi:MAG TPA: hypothetical protein DCZ19_09440 [Porphyromonadaceae bacterium]|nr:hypothetical protein [Porphyromonadaceae bacterium]